MVCRLILPFRSTTKWRHNASLNALNATKSGANDSVAPTRGPGCCGRGGRSPGCRRDGIGGGDGLEEGLGNGREQCPGGGQGPGPEPRQAGTGPVLRGLRLDVEGLRGTGGGDGQA